MQNLPSPSSLLTRLKVTCEPRSYDVAVGIIHGVLKDIPGEDLKTPICATRPVKSVRCVGKSKTVKLVLGTNTTPAFNKVGYTCFYALQNFMSSPLSVPKSPFWALWCTRCGDTHDHPDCFAEHPTCSNCGKRHASILPNCPRYKTGKDIYQCMVSKSLGYHTARIAVLTAKETNPQNFLKEMAHLHGLRNKADFPAHANCHTGLPPRTKFRQGPVKKL